MSPDRFSQITSKYSSLRLAIVGDFCLDRYLEIDPARAETSIETGLPVYNVVRVRAQAGAAGTILNNLVGLGVGVLHAVGFCGEDGEGYELRHTLSRLPGVRIDHFLQTPERRTFTYCKPLIVAEGQPPVELSRLDSKNWTSTPESLGQAIAKGLAALAPELDAIIVMEQVDLPDTGVMTRGVRAALGEIAAAHPQLPIVADSRRGLSDYPSVAFKMNLAELCALLRRSPGLELAEINDGARQLAARSGKPVFVTMAENGIIGATPDGAVAHVESFPVRGPIDIVGAGDSVTANLGAALAAGASITEAMELAMGAASTVIHQLGTTGVATLPEIAELVARR